MTFPDCLTKPNVGNTFGGLDIAQAWQDLALWELFLQACPARSLIELGTWHGGMSLFLALQCRAHGMEFVTIDRADLVGEHWALIEAVGARRLLADAFDPASGVFEIIRGLAKPVVLFCDDGDKRREVREFLPLLAPGDYVVLHDWGAEIDVEDMPPALNMLLARECEMVGSLTRFFRVA